MPAAISPAVFNRVRPSAVAEMISDKYFCRDSVLISLSKPGCAAADIPVLSRLIKAVFFFKDESREEPTGKTSVLNIRTAPKGYRIALYHESPPRHSDLCHVELLYHKVNIEVLP